MSVVDVPLRHPRTLIGAACWTTIKRFRPLLLLAVACAPLTLAAPAPTPAQKGFIVGTVRNEAGQPLAGATINADNLLVSNSNLSATTDAQGRYRIDVRVAPTTWRVTARLNLRYGEESVGAALHPRGSDEVPGRVGGVVDFVFRPKPVTSADPYGNLGKVMFERDVNDNDESFDWKKVQVVLKPVGRLADGTAGQARTLSPIRTGSGWLIPNVMYGTYAVTASLNGRPLELRRRTPDSDQPYRTTYTGGFLRDYSPTDLNMSLEVRLP
ncbi:carboxypeptidase-like regulatory domain-containing protein [Deinococcus radiopugnans]|uniref:Carboxypeptidase regulatory-like domain-containing protein n=1 Tax=Deinococcus radiopugnans ATCC 19172 TaxID=585398 RepID=A0A5C4XYE4_9DEIO|nr:carboxypeptidase-like regulatory domain-containing protein [Deinococcus radiopugnans]MBB6018186.1 hypothetical protein [Deinococcus radiopugnans ATCC 19172]TNM68156.1 carboxypeptidase regulatory-like domain-containing protein [Deinococcus radiopugnans ATCC 19172]